MPYKKETLDALSEKASGISSKSALVGFDGFVDKISTPIGSRFGPGDQFEPIRTMTEYADRVKAAAGKSTNIELYQRKEKLGGNGPIMANALLSGGMGVKYIGALGNPEIHPVFSEFAKKTDAISVCDPGITQALEFEDGKLMLGSMASLDDITYSRLVQIIGEGQFLDCMSRADLVALLNWTMIPHMTAVMNGLVDVIFQTVGPREDRTFFFDLADPEKRSEGDIKGLLTTIKRFQNHGHVILGMNEKESKRISEVIGHAPSDDFEKMAAQIRRDLEIGTVVIHNPKRAACAKKDDTFHTETHFTETPKIKTGAGDHFNAGYATGHILGLGPAVCLTMGVAFASYYVRNALSPTLSDITTFISNWK